MNDLEERGTQAVMTDAKEFAVFSDPRRAKPTGCTPGPCLGPPGPPTCFPCEKCQPCEPGPNNQP